MSFGPRTLLPLLLLSALWARGEESFTFRQWIAGQEAGGASRTSSRTPAGDLEQSHDWTRLERMGAVTEQDLRETALRTPDGGIHFTWTLTLSQEPLQGEADWSPRAPGVLKMTFKNGAPRSLDLPSDATLWPGDADALLKQAARKRQAVTLKTYSLPIQQWSVLSLKPVGPAPLPGFPDTIHFKGQSAEGALSEEVEVWISPTQGEIMQTGTLAGIPLISQRIELPPPVPGPGPEGSGLFERTLKTVPPHPFLLWLPEVKVRWNGKGIQALPEDDQQRREGENRYTLTRAKLPSAKAAAELPVKGHPSAEDAPYLAATPLVQYRDPVFEGLEARLNPPPKATRWELAQLVTSFVYDWIKDKNYTVGFASAQEVARTPRGDCTEHGTLEIALLRRLGVPARGVTGWMAFGETLGLHFWVEAKMGGRWIPLDPTFAQAPASTFRVKLGTSDLADLGAVGWENAASTFLEGAWTPEGPWAEVLRIQGDTATAPDGCRLRAPGGRWTCASGRLSLLLGGPHAVEATPPPAPAELTHARRLQGARSRRKGWWEPSQGQLWIELETGRWLRIQGVPESQAPGLLDTLETRPAPAPVQAGPSRAQACYSRYSWASLRTA